MSIKVLSWSKENKIILLFLIFLLIFTKTYVGSYNDASRMATVESLVERGTFIINNSTYSWTGDKVYIKGNFYSDKLPVLSFLAAGPYFVLTKMGLSFRNNENVVYYILTLLFSGIPSLLTIFLFKRSLGLIKVNKKVKSKLIVALSFGSLLLPWSTVFNNHTITTLSLFAAFYLILKSRLYRRSIFNIFLAGLLSSLALTVDMVVGTIFSLFFLVEICWNFNKKYILTYILAFFPFILLHSILNYRIAKTILPVTFYPQYFLYRGSDWKLEELSGYAKHSLSSLATYTFHMLVGFHGLFSYNPILLIFPFTLLKLKKIRSLKREIVLLSTAIIVTLIFFITRTSNYGGFSYGVRWFIPLIPFMLFIGATYFTREIPHFLPFFLISSLISMIGVINPWTDMTMGEFPIMNNLLLVMK